MRFTNEITDQQAFSASEPVSSKARERRHSGADVTGLCSTANVELVRSLGASQVIDYTHEDFTQNGATYDVIVDIAGTAPYSRSKTSLEKGGRLLMVLGGLPGMLQIPWVSMTSSKKVIRALPNKVLQQRPVSPTLRFAALSGFR